MDNELPKRKKNRLENYDYSSCGAYFLTICTSKRRNYFWGENVGAIIDRPQDVTLSPNGKIVDEAIQTIQNVYSALSVEHYVIMPDHVHLLLMICGDEYGRPMVAPTISQVVKQFKGYVSKCVGASIWQKSFYDHVIRTQKDYDEHVKYIYDNPTNWQNDKTW